MLTLRDKQIIYKYILKGEGAIPHMYLDSNGHVTVGIGYLLASVEAAQQLPFHTRAGKQATAEQIRADYEAVKKQVKVVTGDDSPLAFYYQKFTKLHLERPAIDALVYQHIDNFYRELQQIFPDFDSYPKAAQYALFDMIYTLGYSNLLARFPNMVRAVRLHAWSSAANESRRKSSGPERNRFVSEMFSTAARVAAGEEAPNVLLAELY